MKGLILTLLLSTLALARVAEGQILLEGQTRDTTLAPLPFANVMLVDTITQEMKGFAVTDVNGNFKIRLEKDRVYEMQVTFVGFVPIKQLIRLEKNLTEPLLIIMKEAINSLEQVTVVSEIPVIVRGDTISYKAEAFTKGDERKLEDVLEELPGFNITDNGEIQVQGKTVEKLLVDGKEFFEGDTKLATKNIPADVVDRVQVLQNFNDIAPLSGLGDSDRLALNIELKSDKKRIVFGDLEAGAGPEERYFGHANAFYYAPKTSINLIGDGNNVGELGLTPNDYFRMTGGLRGLAARNGTSFRVSADDMDIPVMDRNSAQDLTNALGALNISAKPSDKIRLSGFLIGFETEATMTSNALRTYTQLANQTEEQLDTETNIDNRSGLGKFSAVYTPNYNLQIDYSFFGKRGTIDESRMRNSQLITGNNELTELGTREPSMQNHQLRMFNALNDRHIVTAELSYAEEKNVDQTRLFSELSLFQSFLSPQSPLFGLTQDQIIDSWQLDGALNYYFIVNKKTHLNAAIGVNLSRQELRADLLGEDEPINSLNQELDITNRYLRLQYRKKWDKLTLSPAVSFNNYTVSSGNEDTRQLQYVFPQLTAQYDFGSSHDIQFSYRQSLEYDNVSAYTEGLVLDRYNTLRLGNASLEPALSHTLNVNYSNFSTYNFLNIYGGLSYQYINDGFTTNQSLAGIENTLTSINSSEANHIFRGYGNVEKRFDFFRVSLGINLTQTILNNEFENQAIQNDNFAQTYNFNASAKLFKILSLRSGYALTINNYESGGISNTFKNYQPNAGLTLKTKGFRFETTYTYTEYVNKELSQSSAFDVLDAELSYRKAKSPWEFKIRAFNLLDTRSVRRDSFSNNLISTFAYAIQQRYGLFTIKYDL